MLGSDRGKRIYVDPFLSGNPKTPDEEKQPERVDVICVTHGHDDHVGDTVELSKHFPDASVIAQVELKSWLASKGANVGELPGLNKGGSTVIDGITFALVNAFHSSSNPDGGYAGEPCGLIVRLEDGRTIYFAGDTCVFGDMQLIGWIYGPDVAVLPIGGHFTMDPREAGVALELLGTKRCIPCHYGTFPLLKGTPEELKQQAPSDVEILSLEPGETITV